MNVFPGLFVKLVPVCQESEGVVSAIAVRPEVFVIDPRLLFFQLERSSTKFWVRTVTGNKNQ